MLLLRPVAATILGLTLMAVATSAQAQSHIAAGYLFQHHESAIEHSGFPLGLDISAERVLGRSVWSLVGDLALSSRQSESPFVSTLAGFPAQGTVATTDRVISAGGGVRWTRPVAGRIRPHAQALVGAARRNVSSVLSPAIAVQSSDTEPMLQVGVGLTHPLVSRLDLLGQFDYRRIFDRGPSSVGLANVNALRDVNAYRAIVGVQVALSKQ